MRPDRVTSSFGLAALCVVSLTAGARSQDPRQTADIQSLKNPVPSTPASIAAGKSLFQKNCRFCHGDDAKGNGPMAPEGSHPANLTDETWDHGSTDGEIFTTIREGAPNTAMKGFKSRMTAQEIWSIVNYVRSIGPKS